MTTFLRLARPGYRPGMWVLYLLLILLTGCSSNTIRLSPSPETSVTISPSVTPSSLPLETPTSTDPSSISPTLTGEPSLVQNCLQVFPKPDRLLGKDYGEIIFDKDSITTALYNKLETPYLFESGVNRKRAIVDGLNFSVSNDAAMFAYQVRDEDKMVVSDVNLKILATSSIKYDEIKGWVNDGLLLYNAESGYSFLNPFNNSRKSLREDFPNRYKMQSVFGGAYAEVYYDPSLTKAFYFARNAQTDSYYFSLWDILADKELVRLPQLGFADSFPAAWSVDGKQVIVYASSVDGKHATLFSVDVNGNIETLLLHGSPPFALSPDGQNLAFWSYENAQENWSLAVLDRETHRVTDYCIKSKYFPSTSPLWSPDGQNLVVYPSDDLENTKTILIDTRQHFAVQIAENARPVGWLK